AREAHHDRMQRIVDRDTERDHRRCDVTMVDLGGAHLLGLLEALGVDVPGAAFALPHLDVATDPQWVDAATGSLPKRGSHAHDLGHEATGELGAEPAAPRRIPGTEHERRGRELE